MVVGENRLTGILLHFDQLGFRFATSFFRRLFTAGAGRRRQDGKTDSTYFSATIMDIEGSTAAGSDEKQTEAK